MILNSKIKKVQVFFLVSPPPLLLFLTGNMLLHVTCTFQMQMCMCVCSIFFTHTKTLYASFNTSGSTWTESVPFFFSLH